jgi:hypothetical protein
VKEIDARELLPVILNLASAINHLRTASVLLAMDRKAEATQILTQVVEEDLEKVLSAAQRVVDQASPHDAV